MGSSIGASYASTTLGLTASANNGSTGSPRTDRSFGMGLVLNVILLVLGLVATLSAFGGKTWMEGTEPLLARITRRGWISLTCLLCTLCLAITKEVRSDQANDSIREERDRTKRTLDRANERLGLLGRELTSTRSDLKHQSQISLITALSHNHPIERGWWFINFRKGSKPTQDVADALLSPLPEPYRSLAKIEVHYRPFMGINTIIQLSRRNGILMMVQPMQKHSGAPPAIITAPERLEIGGNARTQSAFPDQGPKVPFILSQAVGASEEFRGAGLAFRDLSRLSVIGSISMTINTRLNNGMAVKNLIARYPTLKGTGYAELGRGGVDVHFRIPAAIQRQVETYWRHSIDQSVIRLDLADAETHLTIQAKATLNKIEVDQDGMSIRGEFRAVNEPQIVVGIQDL